MVKRACCALMVFFFLTGCNALRQSAHEFFVSSIGNDSWSGKLAEPNKKGTDGPFATLERARDAVRSVKETSGLPEGGMTVWIRGGTYPVAKTFELVERDSGAGNAPVVYRAYKGEDVHLTGGVRLDAGTFKPVTDDAVRARMMSDARDHILGIDLKAQGVTDYGKLVQHGFGMPIVPAALELFFDGEPLTVARYPNEGWMEFEKVTDTGSIPRDGETENRPGAFIYADNRFKRWAMAKDAWLFGTFRYGYAQEYIGIASIDTVRREVRLAQASMYGLNKFIDRFYALNLLEEIDMPGEWYLDNATGILYLWPPSPIEQADVNVSVFEEPFIAVEGASNVTIQGLTLEYGRGMGIYMEGGSGNVIGGCTIRNMGTIAINVGQGVRGYDDGRFFYKHQYPGLTGIPTPRTVGNILAQMYEDTAWDRKAGSRHLISSCDIYNTGTGGVYLGGGDRKTLAPGNNTVLNCHIHHFNRREKAYCPAVLIDGVGNRVANNRINDSEHNAITLSGNDHIIELNEIHDVALASDDVGAVGMGRNPSDAGNIIRYNYFHHIGSRMGGYGTNGVYLDDGTSQQTVYGNVFYKAGKPGKATMGAMFIHGGRENIVENNMFIDCELAYGEAPWPDQRWKDYFDSDLIKTRLYTAVDVSKPPYSEKYPRITKLRDDGKPNKVTRNLFYHCKQPFGRGEPIQEDNWITDEVPGFIDYARENFMLTADAPVLKNIPGFKPIPFDKIGLFVDEYRKALTGEER